jgi:hypothetical protein
VYAHELLFPAEPLAGAGRNNDRVICHFQS